MENSNMNQSRLFGDFSEPQNWNNATQNWNQQAHSNYQQQQLWQEPEKYQPWNQFQQQSWNNQEYVCYQNQKFWRELELHQTWKNTAGSSTSDFEGAQSNFSIPVSVQQDQEGYSEDKMDSLLKQMDMMLDLMHKSESRNQRFEKIVEDQERQNDLMETKLKNLETQLVQKAQEVHRSPAELETSMVMKTLVQKQQEESQFREDEVLKQEKARELQQTRPNVEDQEEERKWETELLLKLWNTETEKRTYLESKELQHNRAEIDDSELKRAEKHLKVEFTVPKSKWHPPIIKDQNLLNQIVEMKRIEEMQREEWSRIKHQKIEEWDKMSLSCVQEDITDPVVAAASIRPQNLKDEDSELHPEKSEHVVGSSVDHHAKGSECEAENLE